MERALVGSRPGHTSFLAFGECLLIPVLLQPFQHHGKLSSLLFLLMETYKPVPVVLSIHRWLHTPPKAHLSCRAKGVTLQVTLQSLTPF